MAFGPNLVQDDAGDFHARIMRRDAAHDGGRRLPLPRNVMNQHDRPSRRGGDVGGGAGAAGRRRNAVEQPHGPFRNDNIRLGARQCREPRHQPLLHRPAVQIEAGASRRRCVKRRVDVIRPAFRGADA